MAVPSGSSVPDAPPGGADTPAAAVRHQYEAYPYPSRDPADEATRLIVGSPSRVAELNHYVFGGRRDFSRPLRVLVAGGGTGDATVQLAQQLADRGCPAAITQLDLSAAALAIADARIAARGLATATTVGVRFVRGSLLDVATAAPGPWDYIDCCGVLHHLPDPAAGVRALAAVLAPDGGMGLMLYAELGRTGVYDVQAMLHRLLDADRRRPGGIAPTAEVGIARRLLRGLPGGNRLRRNPVIGDHLQGDDAGLYDLLLHRIDRAFRVPALFALAAQAGLAVTGLIDPLVYEPATWIDDPGLLQRLDGLPWPDRAAFAELAAGVIKKHVFYAVPQARAGAAVARIAADAVPVPDGFDPIGFAARLRPGTAVRVSVGGAGLAVTLPPLAAAILRLCDGRRTLAQIHAALPDVPGGASVSWPAFETQAGKVLDVLTGSGAMFLATQYDG